MNQETCLTPGISSSLHGNLVAPKPSKTCYKILAVLPNLLNASLEQGFMNNHDRYDSKCLLICLVSYLKIWMKKVH